MSVLQSNNSDVQVWNNAAFDNGDTDESTAIKDSLPSLQSLSFSSSETLELDSLSSKENYAPFLCRSPVCLNSSIPIKPLCPSNRNSHGKPLKVLFKQGLLDLPTRYDSDTGNEAIRDNTMIDAEMEEIQNEITRLSLKLESLRLEKDRNLKQNERNETLVTPKFVEKKQSSKISCVSKKLEKTPAVSNGMKSNRKGMSMGPADIVAGVRSQGGKQDIKPIQLGKNRRGISLGPSEIAAGARLQSRKQEMTPIQSSKSRRGVSLLPSEIIAGVRPQPGKKQELTPILSTQQNRRKSCFYKIQEVDEEDTEHSGGRSLSLSPKRRQGHSQVQASNRRFTTIGSNKTSKKDDQILSSIQPKNLFKEGEKLTTGKRPVRAGRVVASRYSQIPSQCRKMSLPGNDKIENKKCDQKRASSVGKTRVFLSDSGCNQVTEEVSTEAMKFRSLTHNNPPPTLRVGDFLPKLRIIRSRYESPRDSGPAKKVAELMGKKTYFREEDRGSETSYCQALNFEEEDE